MITFIIMFYHKLIAVLYYIIHLQGIVGIISLQTIVMSKYLLKLIIIYKKYICFNYIHLHLDIILFIKIINLRDIGGKIYEIFGIRHFGKLCTHLIACIFKLKQKN